MVSSIQQKIQKTQYTKAEERGKEWRQQRGGRNKKGIKERNLQMEAEETKREGGGEYH